MSPSPSAILVWVVSCSAQPSPLQIISQGQAKAESITLDLGVQIKNVLLLELAAFLRRWVCSCLCMGLGVEATSLRAPSPACVPHGYPS